MAARPVPWPVFHSTPLPNILFLLASYYPDITYAEWPRNPDRISEGYRKFTYSELANAVNASAWWIEENVGKLEDDKKNGKETLVYLGPNDIRYAVLFFASILAGYKAGGVLFREMLYPSPRYGVEALIKLIEAADAKTMLFPETPLPIVTDILQKKEMKNYQIPSVEQYFAKKVAKFPFTKTFAECKDEEILCLHTSGTTGFPKPIRYTHDWLSSISRTLYLPAPPGFVRSDSIIHRSGQGVRAFAVLPPFHGSGVKFMLFFPMLVGMTPIYPPTYTTPEEAVNCALAALDVLHASHEKNAANGDSAKEPGKVVDLVAMVPPGIEILAKHPQTLARLSERTSALCYGGGSISRTAGDVIIQKTKLVNAIASTEMGIWPLIRPLSTDKGRQAQSESEDGKWEYYNIHPAFNITFDPVSTDNSGRTVFEAVTRRNNGKEWGGYIQPLFKILTDVRETRLGDLFIQHPSDPSLYKHQGRADDLLVFLSNEKFFPTVAEQHIAALPGVAEAMLVGTRRPKAALLLRLDDGGTVVDDALWEGIEEVNRDSPVYARVERDMALLVKEPFLKTAKGSVRKLDMLRMYERELDALYGEGC